MRSGIVILVIIKWNRSCGRLRTVGAEYVPFFAEARRACLAAGPPRGTAASSPAAFQQAPELLRTSPGRGQSPREAAARVGRRPAPGRAEPGAGLTVFPARLRGPARLPFRPSLAPPSLVARSSLVSPGGTVPLRLAHTRPRVAWCCRLAALARRDRRP